MNGESGGGRGMVRTSLVFFIMFGFWFCVWRVYRVSIYTKWAFYGLGKANAHIDSVICHDVVFINSFLIYYK